MSLRDTEKDLYDPNSEIEKREHGKSAFNVEKNIDLEDGDNKFEEIKESWENEKNTEVDNNKKKIIITSGVVLGIIFLISIATVGFIKFKQGAFSQSKVGISIEGKESVKSTEDVSYYIKYKNDNRISLKNVEIILNHSENFYPNEVNGFSKYSDRSSKITIGDIDPKSSGEIKITGKFYAAENYTVYLQPEMTYSPENSNSEFKTDSQLGIKIITSPIVLEIKAPKEALNNSTAEYEIKYKNIGTIPFNNLNLRMEYTDGFIFQGATPSPISGNNVWHLGTVEPQEDGVILMQGKIEGDQFDTKSIKATIYKNENNQEEVIFGKAEEITKVVVPPLAVIHKINDQSSLNINLGDKLEYKIDYSNKGNIALRDIIITLKFDSPIIDYVNMDLKTGAYNSNNNIITWKASDISQLKNLNPGDSGEIYLNIPIKKRIDINNKDDKNFLIESIVTIDSSDVAFHSLGASKNISNKVVAKLNSKVILEQQAFFNDLSIENSGPIPPKVGEETTYVVHWKITNISNDISDVRMSAYLPTWAKWKGKTFPEGENISFNERTHEIVWDIGDLKNGVGILNDPREVSLQVGIVPEVNQIGKDVFIMTKTLLTATDEFTLSSIKEEVAEKTTRIKEDKEVDATGYNVVE